MVKPARTFFGKNGERKMFSLQGIGLRNRPYNLSTYREIAFRSTSAICSGLLLQVCLLVGFGMNDSLHSAELKEVILTNIPHVRQKPDFCGEACVEMTLKNLGSRLDQDSVFDRSGLSPLESRGCYTRELVVAVKRLGFEPGKVWYSIPSDKTEANLELLFAEVHASLLAGFPSVLCTHFDNQPNSSEHFRLIVGYDPKSDEVIYHDPALDDGQAMRMTRKQLFELWPLRYDAKNWTAIWIPLKHTTIIDGTKSEGFTDADFAQHMMKLKPRLKDRAFNVVIQPPFVVIGDEDRKTVEDRAVRTVKWAVDRLKSEYFSKDPEQIIDIWLFKDEASYEKHCQEFFDTKPNTPYGFYTPRHNALIMNISTGGGTLVHEIVHPFMATNFTDCPSWFNEGLASLYEQSEDRNGRIAGLTNWRLRGLQLAIKDDRVPAFETLMSTTTEEFYGDDKGTNYAQARYLCYYLQEQGKLQEYYQTFVANVGSDATGISTLKKVLGNEDLDQFKGEWEAFVSRLRF
jgi:Peptidase_C39 like family